MDKRDLERDIARVSSGGSPGRAVGADVDFHELIRRDEPGVMQAAEDLLLSRGWKLREVTGALRARNFTIALHPLWWPRDQWKMVQTNIDTSTYRRLPNGGFVTRTEPGWVWVKMSVANGSVRVTREREFRGVDLDEERKIAVANAWAVAKAIKRLPLTASSATVERIVDEHFSRRSTNLNPRDLF